MPPSVAPPADGSAVKRTVTEEQIIPKGGAFTPGSAEQETNPMFPSLRTGKNPQVAVENWLYMGADANGDFMGPISTTMNEKAIMDAYGPGNYYVVPVNYAGEALANGRKLRLRGFTDPNNPASKLTGDKQIDALTLVQMQLSESRAEKAREAQARQRAEDMHQALMLRMMEGPKQDNGMATVLAAAIQSSSQTMAAVLTSIGGKQGLDPAIQSLMAQQNATMNTLLAGVVQKQPTTADALVEHLARKAIDGGSTFDQDLARANQIAALTGANGTGSIIAALGGLAKDFGVKDWISANAKAKPVLNPPVRTHVTVETPTPPPANGNGHAPAAIAPPPPQTIPNPPAGDQNVTQEQAVAEIDVVLCDDSKQPADVAACLIRHVNDTGAIPKFIIGPLLEAKDDAEKLRGYWTRLGVPHWASEQYAPKVRAALECIGLQS